MPPPAPRQAPAEIGNVVDYSSTHLIAIPKGGLIDPCSASVDDVILDSERSRWDTFFLATLRKQPTILPGKTLSLDEVLRLFAAVPVRT